jgi:4'-phosphopantetheinyl transferase
MPAALDLSPGQAHVWRFSLAVSAERQRALAATLSPDERARVAALRVALARDRLGASRGLLRETLARYTGAPPEALRFCVGPHGKPALAGESSGGLRFNLSHSDDLLLIAVARGHEVGVDVERVRPILGLRQIAPALFTAAERDALERAAPERRDALFAQIWTRHEAIVKGEGRGLAHGAPEARAWSVFELQPEAGYQAALALAGLGWQAGGLATAEEVGLWASFAWRA